MRRKKGYTTMNFEDKDWYVADISKPLSAAHIYEIRGFSDALDAFTDICVIWGEKANQSERLENVNLIKHAPDMYRLLKKCYQYFLQNKDDQFMAGKVKDLLDKIHDIESLEIEVIEE